MSNFDSSIILKVEDCDDSVIDKIVISNYYPIDDNDNKLLISKLNIDETDHKKIYIETDYLKVKQVDIEKNKIIVEVSEGCKNLFNSIDEKCKTLLEELINSDRELGTWDIEWDSEKIDFITLINEETSTGEYGDMKLTINNNTVIKNLSNKISIEDIAENDTIAIVYSLDYISFLLDTMQARTKLFTYYIKVIKQNKYIKEERIIIDDWNFTAKQNLSNIFIKSDIKEDSNIDFKTEFNLNNEQFIEDEQNLENEQVIVLEKEKKKKTPRSKKIEKIETMETKPTKTRGRVSKKSN